MTSTKPQKLSELLGAYLAAGFVLCPIPSGSKGPSTPEWNTQKRALTHTSWHGNVGLMHAYSGTVAIDIDCWDRAVTELSADGIDLQAMIDAPNAVTIVSGKAGHAKLLYRMPNGLVLPSKKLVDVSESGDSYNYLDFRCGTLAGLTVQDVLPPSIHPETGKPYEWGGGGDWRYLPEIPQQLLTFWQTLLAADTSRSIHVPDAATYAANTDTSWEEILTALSFISPNISRRDWVAIGMALHYAGNQTNQLPRAQQIWHEWSTHAPKKYKGPLDITTTWRSFRDNKPTTIKLGTLFKMATAAGWKRATPDASALFSSVNPITPGDLLLDLRPAPPDPDLSIWPAILATRAQELSESIGCDPLVPLFAGLAAVCGAVDARSQLALMPGFSVPPVLWIMTIGEPADKKSPGSKPMLAPLRQIEIDDLPRYRAELLAWEGQEAAYATSKKAFLDFAASPEALLGSTGPDVLPMPQQPVNLRIVVQDINSHKLVRLIADRPEGMLCHLDEMNSWVDRLTNRHSGEDRSAWVVSYEADRYDMDRVGAGNIHCDNLALSIYGNMQPQVLSRNIATLSADGLLQRFIPVILRPSKTKLGNPVPDFMTSAGEWENLLRLVRSLPAQTYTLSPDAYTAFRAFQEKYERRKADERLCRSHPVFMTAFGKIEGVLGRLALVFHLVNEPFSKVVSVETVNNAIRVVNGYIIPAFRYAYSTDGITEPFDAWCSDFIIQYCDKGTVTLQDIRRSARRQLEGVNAFNQTQMILNAMYVLANANWVARIDDGMQENKMIAEWAINPALGELFREHRQEVIAAKQRIMDMHYTDPEKYAPVLRGYTRSSGE